MTTTVTAALRTALAGKLPEEATRLLLDVLGDADDDTLRPVLDALEAEPKSKASAGHEEAARRFGTTTLDAAAGQPEPGTRAHALAEAERRFGRKSA